MIGGTLQQLRMQPLAALHQRDRLEHRHVQVSARAAAARPAGAAPALRRRRHAPPMYSPSSPPIEIGGPAGSPRKPVKPDQACSVNSVAGRSDQGPVQPKSDTVTTMRPRRHVPGALRVEAQLDGPARVAVTITTSARASRSVGSGCHAALPGIQVAEQRCVGAVGGTAPVAVKRRNGSPVAGSTFTTSAPASTRSLPQYAPAIRSLISTTRRSSSGVGEAPLNRTSSRWFLCHLSNFCRIATR